MRSFGLPLCHRDAQLMDERVCINLKPGRHASGHGLDENRLRQSVPLTLFKSIELLVPHVQGVSQLCATQACRFPRRAQLAADSHQLGRCFVPCLVSRLLRAHWGTESLNSSEHNGDFGSCQSDRVHTLTAP